MANLMMLEAKASLPKATRIIGKLIAVYVVGFMLTLNCSSRYLAPVGVLLLAMAAGWLDAIGNECKCHRFFPYKTMNSVGASLFRWQWTVFWACLLFAVSTLHSCTLVGVVHLLQFEFYARLWKVCQMALVPLTLMLLGRAVEPFRFRRARADIEKAKQLLCQLATTHKPSDISALASLMESDKIPFYKLGSVAKLMHDFVANYDATDKLKVVLAQSQESMHAWPGQRFLAAAYAPFRRVANDLLMWESRDVVLYLVVALYIALVYVGSFYFQWTPLAILVPFMGPKSRTARYIQALQENIRLAQGKNAEKKGGLTPSWMPEEGFTGLNWPMVIYIGATHLTALYTIAVLLVFGRVCPLFGRNDAPVTWQTLVLGFTLYVCSALGITAGSHRLWAHRSYKAALPLRILLMVFNSIANQGSIFFWARDHRVHHKYADTKADPHDSNRGFWFSHVGWLLVKENKQVLEATNNVNTQDLQNDPVVMFQHYTDPFWNLLWCFALPSFAVMLWGDSLWNGFLVAGVLRYVCMLNATWAVNSVVHAWGSRPYNPSHATTDNGWVSIFAIGEGWHNWHHAFSSDYAAAELGALLQFNPTKVFIDTMALLGLAWDRKRSTEVWNLRKARWEKEQGRDVVESLEGPLLFKHRLIIFGPEPYDEHHHHHGHSDEDNDAEPQSHSAEPLTQSAEPLEQ